MGSGVSRGPTAVGVPVNPRVQYSHKLEKKECKKVHVDAPILVDVEHGSVRYRQAGNKTAPAKSLKGKEFPYENEQGKELANKEHYFYHTRLKDYGSESSKETEDAFKFYYVLKGPTAAQHKKIYYVYGQGWNAKDGFRRKPTASIGEGRDYAWSSTQQPNSLYYALKFEEQREVSQNEEEDKLLSDLQPAPDKSHIILDVNSEERANGVKARLAIRLLKSVKDIHIVYNNQELRDEDVIGDLQPRQENENGQEQVVQDSFTLSLTLL